MTIHAMHLEASSRSNTQKYKRAVGFLANYEVSNRKIDTLQMRFFNDEGGVPSVSVDVNGKRLRIYGHQDAYLNHIQSSADFHFHEIAKNFLKPDSTILDVGANIGYISLLFSAYYPEINIHAIEPGLQNYSLLQKKLKLINVTI